MDTEQSRKVAQETLDHLFPFAASIIGEGKEHQPMAFLNLHNGETHIVALALDNSQQMADCFASLCKTPGLKVATLLMEAWVHRHTGEPDALTRRLLDKEIRVADLPTKREVLIFNIVALGKQWLCMCPIDRTTNTLTKAELIDTTYRDGSGVVGRFVPGSADLESAMRARAAKRAH